MSLYFYKKIAGKKESKKVSGLNYEDIKQKLVAENLDSSPESIKSLLQDESKLSIKSNEKNLIEKLELSELARKRINEVESTLIIIGMVLEAPNNTDNTIELFNWYIETLELSPGSLGVSANDISSIASIRTAYKKLYEIVSDKKEKYDAAKKLSKGDSFISNEVVYDFGDGWKVVYVPAVGEINSYPGLSGTSHDRILEGNLNGLCLGSENKLYQNNEQGKIFSVRDPENKPRVTIRINNNKLAEAKGKNNLPPDMDGAKKTIHWFETLDSLDYKDSLDFKRFPPLNAEAAIKKFHKDPHSPYKEKWIINWYKAGIPELDADVAKRIKNNDRYLIISELYTKYKEAVEPVVKYFCKLGPINDSPLLTKQNIFKIYRKLPEMQSFVASMGENYSYTFLEYGLTDIDEFKKFSELPIKKTIETNSFVFLKTFSDKEWAQPYLDIAADDASEGYSYQFILNFTQKDWAKPYINKACEIAVDRNLYQILNDISNKKEDIYNVFKPYLEKLVNNFINTAYEDKIEEFAKTLINNDNEWLNPYKDLIIKKYIDIFPITFLDNYKLNNYKDWEKKYINYALKIVDRTNPESLLVYYNRVDLAVKYIQSDPIKYVKISPTIFLQCFSEQDWAQPYIDMAAKIASMDQYSFVRNFIDKEWAKPYLLKDKSKYLEIFGDHNFIEYFKNEDWAEPYIEEILPQMIDNILATNDDEDMLDDIYNFIRLHKENKHAKKYIDKMAKLLFDKDFKYIVTKDFFGIFVDDDLRPYLNMAVQKYIEKFPIGFRRRFAIKEWANEITETPGGKMTWLEYADKVNSSNSETPGVQNKLAKLANLFQRNGLKDYIKLIWELQS